MECVGFAAGSWLVVEAVERDQNQYRACDRTELVVEIGVPNKDFQE